MSPSKGLRRFLPGESSTRKRLGSLAITLSLHALLWLSIINIALGAVMLQTPIDGVLIPSAALILFAAGTTLLYIILHAYISNLRRKGKSADLKTTPRYRKPEYIAARLCSFLVITWLITAAWCIIIAARNPICLPVTKHRLAGWEAGTPCEMQRTATAVSFMALILSFILFIFVSCVKSAFDSNLFGRIDPAIAYEAKDFSSLFDSTSTIHRMHPPTPMASTPTTPMTPPPAVTDVVNRPATSTKPARYHSIRSESQSSNPGPSHEKVLYRSASESSLRQPQPLRRMPSTSNLASVQAMKQFNNQPMHHYHPRGHQRSVSAESYYPQYPSAAAARYAPNQPITYSMALLQNSQMAFNSPSAWRAVHPPPSHFRHAHSTGDLRALSRANSSVASFSTFHQLPVTQNPYLAHLQGRRARTMGSGTGSVTSSRSGHQPYAQSWAGGYNGHPQNKPSMSFAASRSTPVLHRKTSSHSSSNSSHAFGKGSLTSEVLTEVDEEALGGGILASTSSRSKQSGSLPKGQLSKATMSSSQSSTSASSSRSALATNTPASSRSGSAPASRSRSPPQTRFYSPSHILDDSTPDRSASPTGKGGPKGCKRVSPNGEVRKLKKLPKEGTKRTPSYKGKGKARQLVVHL